MDSTWWWGRDKTWSGSANLMLEAKLSFRFLHCPHSSLKHLMLCDLLRGCSFPVGPGRLCGKSREPAHETSFVMSSLYDSWPSCLFNIFLVTFFNPMEVCRIQSWRYTANRCTVQTYTEQARVNQLHHQMTWQESGIHIKGPKGGNNPFIFTPGYFQQVRLRTLEVVVFLNTTRYHRRRHLTTTGFWGWAVRPCAPAPREGLNWDSCSHHFQCRSSSSAEAPPVETECSCKAQKWLTGSSCDNVARPEFCPSLGPGGSKDTAASVGFARVQQPQSSWHPWSVFPSAAKNTEIVT